MYALKYCRIYINRPVDPNMIRQIASSTKSKKCIGIHHDLLSTMSEELQNTINEISETGSIVYFGKRYRFGSEKSIQCIKLDRTSCNLITYNELRRLAYGFLLSSDILTKVDIPDSLLEAQLALPDIIELNVRYYPNKKVLIRIGRLRKIIKTVIINYPK
jgi:hypothetical protein